MNGFETILPFLKPIEHLIVDDSISEVMVNGGDCVFFERNGFLERAHGISIGDRALMVAVKNIARRLGNDISEASPILDSRLPISETLITTGDNRGDIRCHYVKSTYDQDSLASGCGACALRTRPEPLVSGLFNCAEVPELAHILSLISGPF